MGHIRSWRRYALVGLSLPAFILAACVAPVSSPGPTQSVPSATVSSPTVPSGATPSSATETAPATAPMSTAPVSTPGQTEQPPLATGSASPAGVPNFDVIAVIVLENKELSTVIGNPQMANFNTWAKDYTLLTQYYGVRHPSLPNYLAMIGGDTFGVTSDCSNCFVNASNLADLIEASGRTWKGYFEDMPSPCFVGSRAPYAQKHNPFIYFDDIRTNTARCQGSVVPLSQLQTDLQQNSLPNFLFIVPNLCNDAHDCAVSYADRWLGTWVNALLSNARVAQNGLVVITWDEGQGSGSCCGLDTGGGRVATVLISPRVQQGYQDGTPYSHYSLLKTIELAWGLPLIGNTASSSTNPIVAPWLPSR
jgi:hypothetical protein